jgi:hypothetical protein
MILISPVVAGDGVRKFEKQKFHKTEISTAGLTMQTSSPVASNKSKKKAFFFSLLVPGLGELYQNDWKFSGWGSGLYYFTAEAVLWSGHFYLKSYSNWVREDARSLAARSAGVDLNSNKPKNYYVNIGKFSDIYNYNDYQRRTVGTSTVYAETEANFWLWNSDKSRQKYDRLRIRSDNYRNFSQYMFWGVFTNHVLSAVNSMRIFRKLHPLSDARLHFDIIPGSNGYSSYDALAGLSVKF